MTKLKKGELVTVTSAFQVRLIQVQKGIVWATTDGEPKDFVLTSGEALSLGDDETFVLEALDESEIEFHDRVVPAYATSQRRAG